MSSDSELAKKKKRKGIRRIVIGIVILVLFTFPFLSHLAAYGRCATLSGVISDCEVYAGLFGIGIIIGLILIIVGAINITEKNILSKKEFDVKNEMVKDEKIKDLEKRLEKIEDEKTKSQNDSSEDKPENS